MVWLFRRLLVSHTFSFAIGIARDFGCMPLHQNVKTSGTKVIVVGQRVGNVKPPHDLE
jgi:hypothetical protein